MWYMTGRSHKVIVIGTSAGGMQALERLLAHLPADLPAAIFIVQHLSVDSSAPFLVQRLGQHAALACKVAVDREGIVPGTVYMAPPDRHLLLKEEEMLVVRGPRENQFRPSIDPLLRSAAAYYGPHAIGVILTGFLSDGVAGMEAIKRSGGKTVVQDPDDAEFAPLPQNVIRQVETDHVVALEEMAEVLVNLCRQTDPKTAKVPADIWQEVQITERIMTNSAMNDIEELNKIGERVPYSCPECGGSLWELTQPGTLKRYRCHTGHAYTQDSLLLSMSSHLEETLWVAMRTLEERRNILLHMSQNDNQKGNRRWAENQEERAEEMKVHIERLRELLARTALSDQEHIEKAS